MNTLLYDSTDISLTSKMRVIDFLHAGKARFTVTMGDHSHTTLWSNNTIEFKVVYSPGEDLGDVDIPSHYTVWTRPYVVHKDKKEWFILGTWYEHFIYEFYPNGKLPPYNTIFIGFKTVLLHLSQHTVVPFHINSVGVCGKCGRPLRDPESARKGLGPVCAKNLHNNKRNFESIFQGRG